MQRNLFYALEEVGTDALGSVRQQETELTNGKNQSRDSDLVCTLNMFPGFRLPVHGNPWRWPPNFSLISWPTERCNGSAQGAYAGCSPGCGKPSLVVVQWQHPDLCVHLVEVEAGSPASGVVLERLMVPWGTH